MNLALFVEELLWNHDCVVVPGWGGFIANYHSAKKNPITHELFPPSRQLSFNKHLTQQDGLLQSHLSLKLMISLNEAQQLIQGWVKDQQQKLINGEKVLLPQLGIFAHDSAGQIQFIPDETKSLLKSSFGLPAIQLQVTQPHKLIQSTEKSPYPNTKKWIAVAGIAFALGLGIFATQRTLDQIDTAGWNWSSEEITSTYLPNPPQLPENQVKLPSLENLRSITPSGISQLAVNMEEKSKVKTAQELQVKSNITMRNVSSNKSATWIVGGVFVIKDNAEKKVALIKSLGFTKAKVIAFQDRFYACYGVVSNEQEEINLRKKVAQVDPFAWTKR